MKAKEVVKVVVDGAKNVGKKALPWLGFGLVTLGGIINNMNSDKKNKEHLDKLFNEKFGDNK